MPPQNFSLDYLKLVVEPEMRQFCGPIFFSDSLETPTGISNNGSFGLIDTGSKKLLVTCHHVWDEFQKAHYVNPNLKMCVCLDWGPFVVLEAKKPIGEDEKLDVVTFDIEHLLDACGKRKFYPLNQNPPCRVEKGAVVSFVGFPGHFRGIEDGAMGFGRQCFVVAVADHNQDESKFMSNILSLKIPPKKLAGISGSPIFLVRENRPIQLVGFVTKTSMNLLSFTHARCLNPDGTIKPAISI